MHNIPAATTTTAKNKKVTNDIIRIFNIQDLVPYHHFIGNKSFYESQI